MPKYQSKLLVDAIIYETGLEDGFTCIPNPILRCPEHPTRICMVGCAHKEPFIETPFGPQPVKIGDRIITTPDNIRFVCPQEEFDNLYELVPEEIQNV